MWLIAPALDYIREVFGMTASVLSINTTSLYNTILTVQKQQWMH